MVKKTTKNKAVNYKRPTKIKVPPQAQIKRKFEFVHDMQPHKLPPITSLGKAIPERLNVPRDMFEGTVEPIEFSAPTREERINELKPIKDSLKIDWDCIFNKLNKPPKCVVNSLLEMLNDVISEEKYAEAKILLDSIIQIKSLQ